MNVGSEGRRSERLGYLPGVDGLRAVSVLAVFLFHAGVLDGGFIGVDVFFVISGFLITALAMIEIEREGRLGLGAFWARRARRLLPALMLVCAAVLVYSIAERGAALRRVGGDITATILYVANWAQIGDGRDYFAAYDAPPLLQHAWSLAVEEQYYLAWPLILTGVVFGVRRRPEWLRPAVGTVAVAAALASVGISLWLRSQDAGLNRLYLGTDTRAVGLAVGSIAGCYLRPVNVMTPRFRRRVDLLGVSGAVVLVALMVSVDGSERWLYGLGFLAIALASLAVMTAAIGSGGVGRLLGLRPLVSLGRVSYGFYLWHWPVIVVLDADRTGWSGLPLGALWLSVTAVLTALSWFLIERRAPLPIRAIPQRAIAYVAVGAVIVTGALIATRVENDRFESAPFSVPDTLADIDAGQGTETSPPVTSSVTSPATSPVSSTVPAALDPVSAGSSPPSTEPTVATSIATTTIASAPKIPVPADRPLRVLIIGDSVAMSLATSPIEIHEAEPFGAVEVLNVGNLACPVIEEGEWWFTDGVDLRVPADCAGPDRYEAEIDSFRPDVVYALFGWTGGGGGQRLPDGTTVAPCSPGFDQRWSAGYQSLVDRLEQRAIVVISTVAPSDIEAVGHELPTKCLNAVVEQLDALVFDYGDWLCPGYDCSTSSDLRADRVHFSDIEPLRREVTGSILAQVLAIAGY